MSNTLEKQFRSFWARTDTLFEILKPGAIWAQPIAWRHPFIFYLGHVPAFAWNQICRGLLKWKAFNPYFDEIFSRGIDPDVDSGRCHAHPEAPEHWPEPEEVLAYRDRIREAIIEALGVVPAKSRADVMAQRGRVFSMVSEHELMHQETLLYMVQELPYDHKMPPGDLPCHVFGEEPAAIEVDIPTGKATLGASFESLDFGWDNEFPQQTMEVPAFKIDSMPATNGRFLEFVQSGAYEDHRYWTEEDWTWKQSTGTAHPRCWLADGEHWSYRSMFDLVPLSRVLSWPVYVSLAEARAYARWRGKRLPTEAEFQRAAYGNPIGTASPYPWGDAAPAAAHGNFNFLLWTPKPAGSNPAGASAWGIHELVGNGWEWTETPFSPFPGFKPYIEGYPEYSADFFDGKHYVLKGASWATAVELLRPSFRNWYQVHYPYVFAKFRCVSNS